MLLSYMFFSNQTEQNMQNQLPSQNTKTRVENQLKFFLRTLDRAIKSKPQYHLKKTIR